MGDDESRDKNKSLTYLLKSWLMPEEVIEACHTNGITLKHLSLLSDDNLKELCPLLGTRITLKNKISEYLDAQATTETLTHVTDISVNDSGISNADVCFTIGSFPDFDLKTLLETSPCGKSVLLYYNTYGGLDNKRKNRLTDIIIRHLFTYIVNKKLTYDDYNVITGKIISLFPKETPGTYFTRPVKKAESGRGKSIAARGKLIDKVRNILFQSRGHKRLAEEDQQDNKKKHRIDDILLDLLKDDLEWLQENVEPWSEARQRWKNTIEVRHGKDYLNVEDFLSQWKILKSPLASQLIEDDFEYLYPEKVINFKEKWHYFFRKFLELKKHEINSDEDKKQLLSSLNSFECEDVKIPTQIKLLTSVVPPKGRLSKKGKWSTQECIDSLMIFIEKPGDINTAIKKQIENATKRKLQVQPYLILLGSLQQVHQCYIIIDEIRYTFDSVVKAFDCLFKCYHVLNAKYPKPSEHIHLIIQRCVYQITTKFDNPIPYISDILDLAN